MPINKVHIVESVQKETGFTRNRSSEVVENLIEVIESTSNSGDDLCYLSLGDCVSKIRRNVE